MSEQRVPRLGMFLRIMLYVFAIGLGGLSLWEVSERILPAAAEGVFYAVTGVVMIPACIYLYRDLSFCIRHRLRPGLEANVFAGRYLKDYRYRTVLTAYTSFAVSVLFAGYNAVFGLVNRSVWFEALAFYYILLGIMRYRVVHCERAVSAAGENEKVTAMEWKLYRSCGYLFLFLTFALGASVIQITFFGQGKRYSKVYAIAMAAYTFYKLTMSVINMVRAGKLKSPLLFSSRAIGYADGLVSIVSLQTAMILCFGGSTESNARLMNSITGGAACLIIMAMGITMILAAGRNNRIVS